jgi:flagellar basal-body rod protein FlgC
MFSGFDISASGLSAERLRMDIISNNIANVNTTRTTDNKPFRRQMPIFQQRDRVLPVPGIAQPISDQTGMGVRAVGIIEDMSPLEKKYDPGHPHADKDGYVEMPNVNVVKEMVDMITATRAYEANVSVINSTKGMMSQAINISSAK